MLLKHKVASFIAFCFLLFAVMAILISAFVVFPGFRDLQEDEAKEDSHRCISAIKRENYHVSMLTLDWASWSDTYEFVENPKQVYIDSNLDNIFNTSDLNLLLFYNTSGELVWGKTYDSENEKFIDLKPFDKKTLNKDHFLLQHKNLTSDNRGIISTEYGPMLIASRPITRTDQTGPSRGTLIMGKFLNKELVSKITKQIDVKFSIKHASSPNLTEADNATLSIIEENDYILSFARNTH